MIPQIMYPLVDEMMEDVKKQLSDRLSPAMCMVAAYACFEEYNLQAMRKYEEGAKEFECAIDIAAAIEKYMEANPEVAALFDYLSYRESKRLAEEGGLPESAMRGIRENLRQLDAMCQGARGGKKARSSARFRRP